MIRDSLLAVLLIGAFIVAGELAMKGPFTLGSPYVVEVQEGEIWTPPAWVPEPSYAFPAEGKDEN